MCVNDHSDMYLVHAADIRKTLSAFERLNCYFNRNKFLEVVSQLALQGGEIADKDYLLLYKELHAKGLWNGDFAAFIRDYLYERLELMEKETLLEYLQFLEAVGLWFTEKDVLIGLARVFDRRYFEFSLDELFLLRHLISSNFFQF